VPTLRWVIPTETIYLARASISLLILIAGAGLGFTLRCWRWSWRSWPSGRAILLSHSSGRP